MIYPKTKIVCTLGPASHSEEMVGKLIDAGMSIARLNFSHGTHEFHAENIRTIRKVCAQKNKFVAILQDLQGPKIRVGQLLGETITLIKGNKYTLVYGTQTKADEIPVDHKAFDTDISPHQTILLDDGLMEMIVESVSSGRAICRVIHGGILKQRKGVNFPGCQLSIPATTEKDLKDVLFGIKNQVDYVALSFVQHPKDVTELRSYMETNGGYIPIISKIEMMHAIKNIKEICSVSDGIMVARGDMGVECGFSKVAFYQKLVVDTAKSVGKPVIVATQMLDSMIQNPTPTISEVCDVGNAACEEVDATMLSGESASGAYPEDSVKTMRKILDETDKQITYTPLQKQTHTNSDGAFAECVAQISGSSPIKYIICITMTGRFVKEVSKKHPQIPIIAFSPDEKVIRSLALYRGVTGFKKELKHDTTSFFNEIISDLKSKKVLNDGDLILMTGGIPHEDKNKTNLIKVTRVC